MAAAAAAALLNKSLKLALVQLKSGPDKLLNLSNARAKVLQASASGASLIVLPECFNSPYGTRHFPSYAEPIFPTPPDPSSSPSYHALSQMARDANAYLVGGSIPEYVPATKKYYNTSLIFNPSGQLVGHHRKIHLFDIDIPGKITFRESDVLSPGDQLTIVDLPDFGGRIAIAICYDIRFPELAMLAARKENAFALIYPGAFNLTTGPLHWSLLGRARAVDNQVYVALCSPARDMASEYHAYGHSLVCSPNGEIMVEAGEEEEQIVYAELDGQTIQDVRKGIPVNTQRRFDVYEDVKLVE